ncbi:MAG: hypothetical protein IJ730_04185 [Alphaproteobacteria bacterium]|nr:hypothetical protein [Alphaproteobacteria bacterium]
MALISQAEWARRQGFSKQYAAKLIKQGKIHLIDGMIDEYTANAELEMQRNINLPRQRKGGGSYFVQDDMHNLLVKTKLKNEIEKGKLIEAEVKERLGELISVSEVKRVFYAKAKAVREGIMNVPDRLSTLLVTIRDPLEMHRVLSQELRQVLEELSLHEID